MRVLVVFYISGAVGKAKSNTFVTPIDFNWSKTLSKGSLLIYGKGYSSMILAYSAEE
jgi:hypothetical protein